MGGGKLPPGRLSLVRMGAFQDSGKAEGGQPVGGEAQGVAGVRPDPNPCSQLHRPGTGPNADKDRSIFFKK